jgi:hypothetical protein
MPTEQDIDAAIWLQNDSAFLYREVSRHVASGLPASALVASKIQQNAANSACMARKHLGIE